VGFEPGTLALIANVLTNFAEMTDKVSAGLNSRHLCGTAIAATAFRVLTKQRETYVHAAPGAAGSNWRVSTALEALRSLRKISYGELCTVSVTLRDYCTGK